MWIIIGPTLLVSSLWIVVESATYSYSRKLSGAREPTLERHLDATRAADEMQVSLSKLQSVVLNAVEQRSDSLLPEAERYQSVFEHALQQVERESGTSAELSLVAEIRREFAAYSANIRLWLEPPTLEMTSARPSSAEMSQQAQSIMLLSKQFIEFGQRHVERTNQQYARFNDLITYVRLCFFIGGPAIGILFGARVARGLQGSILKLSSQLQDVTQELNPQNGANPSPPSCELPALQDQVHEVSGEISRLVQELDEAREFSARSERLAAVGMLAAGVAHELRNPLTSLKLLVQIAARKKDARTLTDRQLQVLQDQIARMERSIQSLLDFARMPKPQCVSHDLRATIERAVTLVRPRATQLGIRMNEELPDTPVPICGDPAQLHLVFANLFLNGLEGMPEGGTLYVTLTADDPLPDTCCVQISDTGSGIPPELMDRLFEPFVTGKEQGYGLGLTISRRIVHEHGGIISAANRPQGGATFTVELPRGTADLVERESYDEREVSHVQVACH
jgi:signal transduction histidine kinase